MRTIRLRDPTRASTGQQEAAWKQREGGPPLRSARSARVSERTQRPATGQNTSAASMDGLSPPSATPPAAHSRPSSADSPQLDREIPIGATSRQRPYTRNADSESTRARVRRGGGLRRTCGAGLAEAGV